MIHSKSIFSVHIGSVFIYRSTNRNAIPAKMIQYPFFSLGKTVVEFSSQKSQGGTSPVKIVKLAFETWGINLSWPNVIAESQLKSPQATNFLRLTSGHLVSLPWFLLWLSRLMAPRSRKRGTVPWPIVAFHAHFHVTSESSESYHPVQSSTYCPSLEQKRLSAES